MANISEAWGSVTIKATTKEAIAKLLTLIECRLNHSEYNTILPDYEVYQVTDINQIYQEISKRVEDNAINNENGYSVNTGFTKKPVLLKVDQKLLQNYPYVNLFMDINRELTINYPLVDILKVRFGYKMDEKIIPTKNNPIVRVSKKIYDHIVSDANAYYDTVPLKIQRALHQIIDEYLTKNETLNDDEIEWIDHLHK